MAIGVCSVMLALAMGASAASGAGGYGPSGGSGTGGVPGGFSAVVTARTFSRHGGRLTVRIAGARLSISVPRGAFRHLTEVVVTRPNMRVLRGVLSRVGPHGYRTLFGVGVGFLDWTGTNLPAAGFGHPIVVRINASMLKRRIRVLAFESLEKVRTVRFVRVHGGISIRIIGSQVLAIVERR